MITEEYDLTSVLAPPQEQDFGAYLATLQSSAGFLLGKLDWVAQTFFSFSPLEELVKPLCGDWTRLEYAARGFDALAVPLNGVADNLASGAEQLGTVWTGEVAGLAQTELRKFAEGHRLQATGCTVLAEQLRHICEVAKSAGQALAAGLGVLGEILTQLLIENSVPIIGNAFSAGTLPLKMARFFAAVKPILENISKLMRVIAIAMQVINAIKTMMCSLTTSVRLRNGMLMNDTSQVLFGV